MQKVNTQVLVPVLLLCVLFISFLFMITLQKFIDFSIYPLYFYKNSWRNRQCSFYFKDFTIKEMSTFSPKLLLLGFCGLHSICFMVLCFLFFFNFVLSGIHLLLHSMNFVHTAFCLCSGLFWIEHFFWCSLIFYLFIRFRSSDVLKENPVPS